MSEGLSYAGFVLEAMDDVVIVLDPEERIALVNPAGETFLGRPKDQMVGQPYPDVFGPLDETSWMLLDTLRNSRRYDSAVSDYCPLCRRQGHFIMSTMLLKSPDGRVHGAVEIIKDLSARKALEDRLRAAERLAEMGQVAAAAAHEVRNPLTAVKGFLQLLQRRVGWPEREYANIALAHMRRVEAFMQEFLLLARPTDLHHKDVDLSDLLLEVGSQVWLEVNASDTEAQPNPHFLQAEVEPGLVVQGDPERLTQVVVNLLQNAREVMPTGGTVTLLARREQPSRAQIVVRDQGPGLPQGIRGDIFAPFVSSKPAGTGLGLTICRRIVEGHGGTIEARNAPAGGAEFIVNLPLAAG
ncbi:MAG: two-component system sensor histidine kinase NtrB [Bacillota bacterium]